MKERESERERERERKRETCKSVTIVNFCGQNVFEKNL